MFQPPVCYPAKRSSQHGWFPRNGEVHQAFVKSKIKGAIILRNGVPNSCGSKPLHSDPVAHFAHAIKINPIMRNLFDKIFLQVNTDPKWVDPRYVVTDFDTLLYVLDVIIHEAPAYYKSERADGTIIGALIGIPMYLVFDLLGNTAAGYDLFRMDEFNRAVKPLLDAWGRYLTTPESTSTLHGGPEGWFSREAMADFEPFVKPLTFETTYTCPNPSAENKGFPNWDAFFTRKLQPTARPVHFPDDNNYIHNACESTAFRIAPDVKLHDQFWLKEQKYSLYDMLGGEEDALPFVGGTVYQGFLTPHDYHRWHSPVNGMVKKAVVIPGTYFAVMPDEGALPNDAYLEQGDPHGALARSQPYFAMFATRALIFIEADNPNLGLLCFVGIGMVEVSTCELSVHAGDRVKIGQEIGMFHFGGSSHAVVFGPQAKIRFETLDSEATGLVPLELGTHYWINSIIGTVSGN